MPRHVGRSASAEPAASRRRTAVRPSIGRFLSWITTWPCPRTPSVRPPPARADGDHLVQGGRHPLYLRLPGGAMRSAVLRYRGTMFQCGDSRYGRPASERSVQQVSAVASLSTKTMPLQRSPASAHGLLTRHPGRNRLRAAMPPETGPNHGTASPSPGLSRGKPLHPLAQGTRGGFRPDSPSRALRASGSRRARGAVVRKRSLEVMARSVPGTFDNGGRTRHPSSAPLLSRPGTAAGITSRSSAGG